jgi:hypothetical protein
MQHGKVTALPAALLLTLGFVEDAHAQGPDKPWLIQVRSWYIQPGLAERGSGTRHAELRVLPQGSL